MIAKNSSNAFAIWAIISQLSLWANREAVACRQRSQHETNYQITGDYSQSLFGSQIQLFFSHLTTTFIVSYIFSLIIEYPFLSLERVLHTLTHTGTYKPKPKLYSVTSVDSTASESRILDRILDRRLSDVSADVSERYNCLKPFARLPDIDLGFRSLRNDSIVSEKSQKSAECEPNKLVFKL